MTILQPKCLLKTLGILSLTLLTPQFVSGASSFTTSGAEYAPIGRLPGDQMHAALSLNASGGLLVWQDNITDGDGLGIGMQRLDNTFSPSLGTFQVNAQSAGDQENPDVTLLPNGGAAVVFQGGTNGFQHIYARFLSASNTWLTGDVMVNTSPAYQINPAVAGLASGNAVVAWSSFGQDAPDGLQGVYAQLISPTGQKVGGELLVNQFTNYNQRTPAIASRGAAGFVVAWVSEQQRFLNSVDIYARLYDVNANPLGGEFLVNTGTNVSANPRVAAAADGSFLIAWGQKDTVNKNNSWDVFARAFSPAGTGGVVRRVNTQTYGDQFAPKVSALGTNYLVVWTSMGQDGSREGVFGQFLYADGTPLDGEIQVNSTTLNEQSTPAVASDGVGRFLVAWSGYTDGPNSMDLYAQRYVRFQQPLAAPGAPFVSAISSSRLSVSWPPVGGFPVAYYDLYVDGSSAGILITNIQWTMINLPPSSTHSFTLDYVLADGRQSPVSSAGSGTTWGEDNNFDGLPDDWQATYWGNNPANWPSPATHLGGSTGPTVATVFQMGANPLDPATWLRQSVVQTASGFYLEWNTQPGFVYQVEVSNDLKTWAAQGSPRFAAGAADSLFLGLTGNQALFKVRRVRY